MKIRMLGLLAALLGIAIKIDGLPYGAPDSRLVETPTSGL